MVDVAADNTDELSIEEAMSSMRGCYPSYPAVLVTWKQFSNDWRSWRASQHTLALQFIVMVAYINDWLHRQHSSTPQAQSYGT